MVILLPWIWILQVVEEVKHTVADELPIVYTSTYRSKVRCVQKSLMTASKATFRVPGVSFFWLQSV